jgi:hypothetical protein
MYEWYQWSEVCYVYLDDVLKGIREEADYISNFRQSKWFTRGWTIQELIAPSEVIFFDQTWQAIGTKTSLVHHISLTTRIRKEILENGFHQHNPSVAEKMSWAAGRKTTREEDRAYSLLGLFGLHMSPISGEGGQAFRRLQELIVATTTDHSIFAWHTGSVSRSILASSPDQFTGPVSYPVKHSEYKLVFDHLGYDHEPTLTVTNYGLRIALPLIEIPNYPGYYRAFLACSALGLEEQTVKATDVKRPASNSRIKPLAGLKPAPVHQRLEAALSTIFLSKSTDGPDSTYFRVHMKRNWTDTWIGTLDKPNNKNATGKPKLTAITRFILAHENAFPLQLDCLGSQPGEQEHPHEPLAQGDTYLTLVLAKTHRAIRITSADVWPDTGCMSENEFTMDAHSGWCMRLEEVSGRAIYPGLRDALVTDDFRASFLSFKGNGWDSTRRLAILMLASTHSSHNRVLVVLVTRFGCSYIFLASVSSEGIDARSCREDLLGHGKPQPWLQSGFVGACIPFKRQQSLKLKMGRYTVNVDREDHTLTSRLAFRLTVGLGPLQPQKENGDAKQHVQIATECIVVDGVEVSGIQFCT